MSRLLTYFAYCESSKLWKIGRSSNLKQRVTMLQAYHKGLVIKGVYLHSVVGEAASHRRFHRHRIHGEWFRDCRAIRSFVKSTRSLISTPIDCRWTGVAAIGRLFPAQMQQTTVGISYSDLQRFKRMGGGSAIVAMVFVDSGHKILLKLIERD